MKETILTIISAAVILSSLTGCSSVNKDKYINGSSQASDSASSDEISQNSAAFSDWRNLSFGIDSVTYTPEFNLTDLTGAGWSFDPEVYGLQDYTVTPGLKLSCDVYLAREGCDDGVLAVGFANTGSEDVSLDSCQVWAVRVDIKDKSQYPSFNIPGNIQWSASADDIKAALGDPSETKQEDGCTELVYNQDGVKIVHYYVYDNGGLQKFMIEKY